MGIHQLLLGGGGELVVVISATATNLNAATLFGSNYGSGVAKRLIINSGVTIGGTSAASPALTIPTGLAGSLLIDNYGAIQGAGGVGGTSGAGGDGGNAILAQAACRIINNAGATIYGGGGGGGRGGNGGDGGGGFYYYTATQILGDPYNVGSDCDQACRNYPYGDWSDAYCYADCYVGYDNDGIRADSCWTCARNYTATAYTSGGSGGAGGAGGRGQGYEGALAAGAAGAGGAAGGTNAGAGGTGGTGGSGASWGATGVTGNTGGTGANGNNGAGAGGASGSAGGLAGFYINGLSTFVTLTNSGTVAGRSN
jgi:hypothetical protein